MRKSMKRMVSTAMALVLAAGSMGYIGNFAEPVYAADSSELPFIPVEDTITSVSHVSVHDPSIVYGEDGYYYIFGSHKAWAKSKDLANWSTFNTNINTDYASIFKIPGNWAAKGGSGYDISGNLWAPDVIWNPTMKKWCMYMSVNGNDFTSSIALATADKITGPYSYQGIVVYSGFKASGSRSYTYTDYQKATGSTNVNRFLSGGNWNSLYGTNAIDPCVKFDENGDLWMSYGSWFGGIYMLKLDKETGLRDYTYTYTTVTNQSDAYMGIKIAGGYGNSGEGSYITYDSETGYYYLYLSYNGLDATDNFSGYHLRMYRSKKITGPYVDAAGNQAIYTYQGQDQSTHGVKLFGNYAFSSMKNNGQSSADGYKSGGHNSAMIDEEGNHFLIYHTRFNNDTEWHEVRVHQQFMNEDGWLVTAPYEYCGSKINEEGYTVSEIAGTYEFINHGLLAQTANIGMLDTLKVVLSEDGQVYGDVSGTWQEKDGSYYATMVLDGVEYKGVFFKQYDESAQAKEVMTFTLIGENNASVWGSKVDGDTTVVTKALKAAFAGELSGNLVIPQFGDVSVSVSVDSEYLTADNENHKLICKAPEETAKVELKAVIEKNGAQTNMTLPVTIKGYAEIGEQGELLACYDFEHTLREDSSGNNNMAEAFGTTIVMDAQRGNVAAFDGVDDYLELPQSLLQSDDFTFLAWVKVKEQANWARVFDFGDGEGKSIFLTTHGYNPECIRAAYAVNAEEKQANSTRIQDVDVWTHMAVTVNSQTNTMTLYLNGTAVDTVSLSGNITQSFKGLQNYLGKSQYADPYFSGYMDDVMIFGGALSQTDIKNYMEQGLKETVPEIEENAGVLVTSFGKTAQIKEAAELTSGDSSVAKVLSDGKVVFISQGTTNLTVTMQDGTKKSIRCRVEDADDTAYGDVNTDGMIDVRDMEMIQKHILKLQTLNDVQLRSAKVWSFDGNLSVLDMETIQKNILKISTIIKIQ